MNSILNLSAKQLRRAADLREKIEALLGELNQLLDSEERLVPSTPSRRRKVSAAGRARIAAAARARWARIHAATRAEGASKRKGKRKLSRAARARISAAATERWRKAKAEGRSHL